MLRIDEWNYALEDNEAINHDTFVDLFEIMQNRQGRFVVGTRRYQFDDYVVDEQTASQMAQRYQSLKLSKVRACAYFSSYILCNSPSAMSL